MGRIFFACVDVFASLVFILPIFAVLQRAAFRNAKHTALYGIFAFYLIAVMSLVGLPSVTYIQLDFTINVVPLADLIADVKNALLNVLLFVPMGFFLSILWEKYRQFKNAVIVCLCISAVIEGLQIFTFRTTDINDLITNTLGGMIGFFAARITTKGFSKFTCSDTKQYEMYIVFAVSFMVMFFGVPFVSGFLWECIQ